MQELGKIAWEKCPLGLFNTVWAEVDLVVDGDERIVRVVRND